ncbi:probable receptor-like protein kinase at3g55450 [Phtheirospermum japonicum]|uniref:Probable receptor-like protein kinase at3g55450 n=1 Tax=Phtheirospermum japonicum TaxID=374723 RepID=A0A830CE73_9LAMI|nr:probable receptor-like protein kinase at3g55450 [Phtheirospermum japonicum]
MDARIEGQYSPAGTLKAAIIFVRCLAMEPKYRPAMDEVVKALEQLQDNYSLKIEGADQHKYRQACADDDSSRRAASYPRPFATKCM